MLQNLGRVAAAIVIAASLVLVANWPRAAAQTDANADPLAKAAQQEWIKYRDVEFKLTDSVYDRLQGTMYIPMRADHRMQIVKQRAIELKDYLDLLKDN